MKKKLLLLPFLAALALAGCSNDDDLAAGSEEPETGELRYLAVNIVTPRETSNTPMSRAEFQDGTVDEDAVNSALFILLNGENKVSQTVSVTGDELKPWSGMGQSGSVENISSAVLVISGNAEDPGVSGILAVLNPAASVTTAITNNMTLDAVKAIVNDYQTGCTGNGTFVMSNSAYVADNAVQLAVGVKPENLARTAEAAKNHPVEIYVERAVAKITTNAVADIETVGDTNFNRGASVTLKGETAATPLKIVIKGIQIANCAKRSHLFKNIEGFAATAPFTNTDWNDAANHRSYWAQPVTPALALPADYENHSWNEISGVGGAAKALTDAHTFYAQENIHSLGTGAGPGHTAVIVTAQLQKEGNGGEYEAFDFVELAEEFYTADDALKQLAGYLNSAGYRVKTTSGSETKYENLAQTSLEWRTSAPATATSVKGWEGFAQLAAAYKTDRAFAKYDATEGAYKDVTVEQIDTALEDEAFRVLKWTDGACYYFVDIEHFGATAEGAKLKGIIRNHIYSLNLQSLQGLGVPVFDPTVDIIPEKPSDEALFYLAARINILKWVLVSQDVNFE